MNWFISGVWSCLVWCIFKSRLLPMP